MIEIMIEKCPHGVALALGSFGCAMCMMLSPAALPVPGAAVHAAPPPAAELVQAQDVPHSPQDGNGLTSYAGGVWAVGTATGVSGSGSAALPPVEIAAIGAATNPV